jgi:hypothetical protein
VADVGVNEFRVIVTLNQYEYLVPTWTFVFVWCNQFHRETWGNCLFQRTRGWLVVKQIWNNMRKYETDMKIANVHVGTIRWRWEYETDMRKWNWYENLKLIWKLHLLSLIFSRFAQFDILTFLCINPTWSFSIFILDAAGMKIHLAGIKTRSQRKNGLRSSYVDVCNFQYGETQREWQLFRRKNVSVGLRR